MIKIDFKGNQIDFWKAIFFAINQKIPMHSVLEQAFEQKVLVDSNNNLLLNFLEFLKFNKNHPKSQLMQDLFAAFILQNKSSNTFLEFGATDGLS